VKYKIDKAQDFGQTTFSKISSAEASLVPTLTLDRTLYLPDKLSKEKYSNLLERYNMLSKLEYETLLDDIKLLLIFNDNVKDDVVINQYRLNMKRRNQNV
jgi:hypothetical protein